jgi:hypothetical protein
MDCKSLELVFDEVKLLDKSDSDSNIMLNKIGMALKAERESKLTGESSTWKALEAQCIKSKLFLKYIKVDYEFYNNPTQILSK